MNGFDNFGSNFNEKDLKGIKAQEFIKEFNEFKDKYEKSEMIRNKLLQDINDNLEGGLTSRNFASSRNTIVFNESDSLDSDYPFIMDFAVLPETIKIAKVEVSFKIKKFRAYSKAGVAAGTPSGGGTTTGYTGTPSGGGKTSSTPSAYYVDVVGGESLELDWATNVGDENWGCYVITQGDAVNVATYNHTHTVADHTHTNHYHTTPDHTHPAHTHIAVYGIFEEDTSPTIHFWLSEDGGGIWKAKHGGYTKDQINLEITSYLTGIGEKMLKFTSDVRCRISARVMLKLDIKAR